MTPGQRSLWINWGLMLTAIGLLALVLATSRSVTSGERESRARHLLTAFRSDEVTRVSYEKGGERWVIDKRVEPDIPASGQDSPRWQFVQPIQGEAEEATLDQLLRAAQFATWLRRVDPASVDRKTFGLDAPRAMLDIEMGTIVYRLRLGDRAPAPPGAHYLEVTGEGAPETGVYVVSQSTAEDLSPDPEDFRIRQLIAYSGAGLSRIEAKADGESVRLVRHGRSGFRLEGSGVRLSRVSVDQLSLAFSRTRAEKFVELGQAEEIQRKAKGLVELSLVPTDKKQPTAVVTIGGPCPDEPALLVAVRTAPRPAAACIEDPRLHDIFTKPDWLVDRSLFAANLDEVERLAIVQGDSKLTLARAGNGFELREPEKAPVESGAVEQRLRELLGTRGKLVPPTEVASLGLEAPLLGVTLDRATSLPEGDQQIVELSRGRDGEFYARRLDDGAVLQVAASVLRVLSTNPRLLQSRQLLDLQAKEVAQVSVMHDGTRWVLAQPTQGDFELLSPERFAVDTSIAVAWVEAVRQLRVERWVAVDDDGSFGLEAPLMRFSVTDHDGKELGVVVGGKASGGYFARRVENKEGIFVLDRAIVRTLSQLIIDRSGFNFDPDLAQTIRIRHGESQVELVRLGSELVQQGGNLELSPTQVTALLDALSMVRPEAAVAFDAGAERYDFSRPLLDVSYSLEVGGEIVNGHYQVGAGDYHDDVVVYSARLVGKRVVYVIPQQLIRDVLGVL